MAEISYLFSLFISLVVTSFPFLLLGIILSSTLLVFVDEAWLLAKLPRNRLLGAILGSILGLVIPVGQYGQIPLTRRLLLKGVSLPIAISFAVASPILNPWVIGLTWSLFPNQSQIVFFIAIIAWFCAILLGLFFSFYPKHTHPKLILANRSPILRTGSFLKISEPSQPLHRSGNIIYEYASSSSVSLSASQKIQLWLENSIRELTELGGILVLTCAIAAIMQFYLVPSYLIHPEQSSGFQILSLFGLSFWLSSGAFLGTSFISVFSGQILKGSLLAFLLFSAWIDIKGISLMLATLRPKVVLILLLLISQLVFVITLLLNFFMNSLP